MGLQNVWGPFIAWYLFLAGAGAGAYLVGVLANRMGERFRLLVKPGIFLGAPLVAIGSGLLLLDLGNPFAFLLAFLRPQSSMISLGIIIITVFILLGLAHIGALWFAIPKLSARALRWLGGVNAVFALGTAVYTGLLLGVVKAVPFWNTPILPLLFLISAVSTGIGAILFVVGLLRWIAPGMNDAEKSQVVESVHVLGRIDLTFVLGELVVLFFLLALMLASPSVAADSARYLLNGGYAMAFWLGVVLIGLLLPVALEVWTLTRGRQAKLSQLMGFAVLVGLCLLVGGVVLRYAILAAGANVAGTM